jgi:hypothetical protein
MKLKAWLTAATFTIVVALVVALSYSIKQTKELREKWKTAMANVKAYDSMLGESNKKNAAFQLTLDQLKSYQDTILRELHETQKELKIKDKNIQSLQYVYSTIEKRDTINFRDTIFKEPSLKIDTVIGDKWCKTKLSLEYPSKISVNPEFRSEKHILVSMRKETVNPPKKFWLFRLFQRKHKVLQVDVVEKNPYVDEQESKYFEIIK